MTKFVWGINVIKLSAEMECINGTRAKKADSTGNTTYYIGDHFEVEGWGQILPGCCPKHTFKLLKNY